MPKAKQITAWMESKPGELGRIAEALGKAKVNITAFSAWSLTGESPVHFLVSSPVKAKKVLEGLGIRCTEEEVLHITLADQPGKLGEAAVRLGAANINVDYGYGSVAEGSKKAEIVLAVSDLAGATKVLRGL